jgi:hypothetical protein
LRSAIFPAGGITGVEFLLGVTTIRHCLRSVRRFRDALAFHLDDLHRRVNGTSIASRNPAQWI